MKKVELLYIAFILLLFSGCTKDILNDVPINKDGSIAFLTDSMITKGTPQNDLKVYDKVNLVSYSHKDKYADGKSSYRNVVLNKDGSNASHLKWNYDPPMFWPEGRGLSFFAYAIESNISYVTTQGQQGVFINKTDLTNPPVIEYIVPQDVKKHPDIIIATLLDLSMINNVVLPMKHALSCVSFCGTGPSDMKVKNISLKNVYSKASLKLDNKSITWDIDLSSKNNLNILEPGIDPDKPLEGNPDDNNYLMTEDGYMMMIPQTLTDAYIDVTYWDGVSAEEKIIKYTLPTTVNWEPGKKYIYKFGENMEETVVVYYEKYGDGSYGLHSNIYKDITPKLDDNKPIIEAGYGVLTKKRIKNNPPTIQLGTGSAIPTKKVTKEGGTGIEDDYILYTVSQTSISGSQTFALPSIVSTTAVYFDGSNTPCGKIMPHFAKGVHEFNQAEYAIRTPQQMRNISELTENDPWTNGTASITFKQERDLDFAELTKNIGGGSLTKPVVDEHFSGTYDGNSMSISNVVINAPNSDYVGLFSQSIGKLNNITLKSSSITGQNYVGGIIGYIYGDNAEINKPRIIGTSTATPVNITGVSNIGGIVGNNRGKLTGNTAKEPATTTTVAEVSGWVNITGTGDNVGGVAGNNLNWNSNGSINTVLVYGVYVNGTNEGNFVDSKIVIRGNNMVGGIVGNNNYDINGNITVTGSGDVTNMPDVAGIVEVRGVNSVGGITGANGTTGKLNSVNIRLGREPATIINGTGDGVGGIVGLNTGKIGMDSDNTFISIRGNIAITGNNYVGGIVGSNSSNAEIKNCFVYDFYNPLGTQKHYAPTIKSNNNSVGGIAGSNSALINNCSVFSASGSRINISAGSVNAGGIVGLNDIGGKTTNCSMIGPVTVESTGNNAGGISGNNKGSTSISKCWVGSNDGYNIIGNAVKNLGLIITYPGGSPVYGTPNITGKDCIGGIVGLNDGGVIDGVELADNAIIGKKEINAGDGSNFVGGIAGGNTASYLGTNNIIKNCTVKNTTTTSVVIQGSRNLGGIVGLSNGMVANCTFSGASGNPIKIIGLGTIGGIVGQLGGNSSLKTPAGKEHSGNIYTTIKNCKVTGFVILNGHILGHAPQSATEVGGIVGLAGPNENNVIGIENCVVGKDGAVEISVDGSVGGIVGTNAANIEKCDVYNATIKSTSYKDQSQDTDPYAGGIAGITITSSTLFNNPEGTYRSDINDCRVYYAVITSYGWGTFNNGYAGALVGYLNSDIIFGFGTKVANLVNSSNITINDGKIPTTGNYIVGLATSDPVNPNKKATINHAVQGIAPR